MCLLKLLRKWLCPKPLPVFIPKPGKIDLKNLSETLFMKLQAILPELTANDVTVQEIKINDTVTQVSKDAKTYDFEAEEGMSVTLSVRFGDDATPMNWSEFSEPFTATVTDTIAPAKPGQVGFKVVGE